MSFERINVKLKDILLKYDKRSVKSIISSYDALALIRKVDSYISSMVSRDENTIYEKISLIKDNGFYYVRDREYDLAIAKIVADPSLIRNFDRLYEHIILKTKPYLEASPNFFDRIQAKVSYGILENAYIDVDDIDFTKEFDEKILIAKPDFVSLLRRTAKRSYEKMVVVRKDRISGRYVCIKNAHILYVHKMIVHFDEYKDIISEFVRDEIEQASKNKFFRKIRVDTGHNKEERIESVHVNDINFYNLVDIFYHYIYEEPELFHQLVNNIMTRGLKPTDVNAYFEDGKIISPYKGIYPILGLKAIKYPDELERVFPEMAESIMNHPSRRVFDELSFSYHLCEEEDPSESRLDRVVGLLSTVEEEVLEADVDIVDDVEDQEEEEESAEEFNEVEEFEVQKNEELAKRKLLSITETIEIANPFSIQLLDRRLDSPVRYGLTSLKLDEIEGIVDYEKEIRNAMNSFFYNETIDLMTMRKDFPILKAAPSSDGLYRINPVDNKYVLMKMIHIQPSIVSGINKKLAEEVAKAKKFYDVKRYLNVDIKIPQEEKSKKGNIFHHLTDGQLDRSLLKIDPSMMTNRQMIERSVIIDKDLLEKFNPIKDPVIFFRTVRSFLECLFHLYYIHLDEANIYHDNGKWTDKFKPLSAWVTMFTYIHNKLPCAPQVFPDEIWKAVKESLRVEVVYTLNEVVHFSAAAATRVEECRDFIWQNASLETLIKYVLMNFKTLKEN